MPMPEWLQVDSLVPTAKEFRETSDAGTFHRRASSSITAVDKALVEFWTQWVKARTAALAAALPPTAAARMSGELWRVAEERRLLTRSTASVTAAKGGLEALIAACDAYLLKQTALDSDTLDRAMGRLGIASVHTTAAGAVRARIAGLAAAKQDRVAPTLGLRYIAKVELQRVNAWVSGPPPLLDFRDAWAGGPSLAPIRRGSREEVEGH